MQNVFLKKYPLVITIQENCSHQKQINIHRVGIHYSHTSFDYNKSKHFYWAERSMRKFYADLKKHVIEIFNFKKKRNAIPDRETV